MKRAARWLFPLLIGLGTLLALGLGRGRSLAEAVTCNLANRSLARLAWQTGLNAAGPHEPPAFSPAQAAPACLDFQAGLYAAYLANNQPEAQASPQGLEPALSSWKRALQASPSYLGAVQAHAPADEGLAQAAVQAYPRHPRAWTWLAEAALAQGRQAEALIAYHRAASLQPSNHLVWESLGGLAERQANLPLARQAYQAACDLYPVRNGSCLSAGRLAFNDQDWQAVTYYYQRGSYPESADGWARLILAGRKLGLAQAAGWLEQARQEYPADYEALIKELE